MSAACDAEESDGVTAEVEASPGADLDVASMQLRSVRPDDAAEIARKFVESHADLVPLWKDARVDAGVELFGAEGVAYYLHSVVAPSGVAAGSVTVGAHEGKGVVAAFTVEGVPVTATLLSEIRAASGGRVDADAVTFLAEGPSLVFAELTWDRGWGPPEEHGFIPGADGSRVYYSPDLATLTRRVDRAHWPSPARTPAREELDDERELRSLYLALDGEALRDAVAASEWVSAARTHTRTVINEIGDGSPSFDSWYQEWRDWGNGTCHAGCAPVAAAILLDYWDENGYGNILPGWNDTHTTTDARASIKALRTAMGTVCTADGQGSTSISNIDNGEVFTDARGFNWTWTEYTWSMWTTILNSIDSGYPVILSAKISTNSRHSAVVVEYKDDWGTANDYFCWKTGWKDLNYQCVNRSSYTWYNVVGVTPY